MTLTGAVLLRTLVPPTAGDQASPGFTVVSDDLAGGLPAVIPLSPHLSVALVLGTGQVRAWTDADPGILVSASDTDPGWSLGDAGRPSLRLLLLADRVIAGSTALIPGVVRLLPDDGTAPAQIGVVILSWRVTAGCVTGPGAPGCSLRLAWRPVGGAADVASAPPQRPDVAVPPDWPSGYAPVADPSGLRGW
jgi:hypothetical protein